MLESCRDAMGFVDHGFAEIVLLLKASRNLPAGSVWDPSGIQRDPTAPVGPIRIPAQDVLQITRVPTRDPTGSDFAGAPRKRFWLQRCAFLATGSERVPTGADCASRSDSSSRTGIVANHAGADAGADGYRLRRRAAETRLAAALCVSCSGIRTGADCATPTTAQPQPHPLSGRSDRCSASEIVIF